MHLITKPLHPYLYLLLPGLGLANILTTTNPFNYGVVSCWMLANLWLITPQLKYKILFKYCLGLVPIIAATIISSYYFAAPAAAKVQTTPWLFSLSLGLRIACLSLTSFFYALHTPWENLILTLIQRQWLSVKLGYALLAIFNASHYLGNEFQRIQLAYQMRYGHKYWSPKIVLPLCVAAARYAHSLSISIASRGLNQKKSYWHAAPIFTSGDWLILSVNVAFISLSWIILNY